MNGSVEFMASIPMSAGAIAIDGGANEGGRLKIDIPGTHLAQLLALTAMRGCPLLVTVAVMQQELPLSPAMPEDQEHLFPTDPAFVRPLHEQAAAIVTEDGDGMATGANAVSTARGLPDHVHTFGIDGRCLAAGCTYRRVPVFGESTGSPSTSSSASSTEGGKQEVKSRRVRRGALAGGRKRAKA